eukprot:UN11043
MARNARRLFLPLQKRQFATFAERAKSHPIKLEIGDTGTFTRSFTRKDMLLYADIVGDTNPLYIDTHTATKEGFRPENHVSPAHPDEFSGTENELMANSTLVSSLFAAAVGP